MRTGLIGTKIGSSSYFNDDGKMIPVTLIKIDECIVSNVRTKEKNGYDALQIASIENNLKLKNIKKPQKKIFAELDISPKRYLREFRINKDNFKDVGSKIDISHFVKGQHVDVSGTSIGKGFAGSMKRHNFAGLRASHGVSISHRSHGSTGNCQDPGRVFKGKKMAGHMGAKKVTKQNLVVIDIDKENKILLIKGSVPGKPNSIVIIKDSIKKK
tara:strand:- start:48 stop:689 length:642 start_codon:yes stop_codon:yes gene_type:complete